jgi:D-tyrosyl-tRNA(Tyr) deacylase
MRVVLQRVSRASVTVEGMVKGQIGPGLLVFVGFRKGDTSAELEFLARKLTGLRIFEDDSGKMNLSVTDINAELLIVSQFTLYGVAQKGNRPSFIEAEEPVQAEALYNSFIELLRTLRGEAKVSTGVFRAMMQVELVNSGPVTLILDKCHS